MSRNPFVVDVLSLRRRHGQRERLLTHGRLGGLVVTGAAVPDEADIRVDVILEAVDGGIVVKGEVQAPWVGECRRCLGRIDGALVAPLEEVFVAKPEEGDTWPIDHNHIDLEPVAREAAVLELPLALLCRPDCRGLCVSCGADLNEGPCRCAPETVATRWADLDVLRTDPPAG
jgi:uncharacterized protein